MILKFTVTGILLAWAVSRINHEEFKKLCSEARWEYLLAVWLSSVVCFWVRSFKMKLILRQLGCSVTVHTLFAVTTVTTFYGLFLPGALNTGAKWLLLRKITSKGANVLGAMIYNQLSIAATMVGFGLGALIQCNPSELLMKQQGNTLVIPVVCSVLLAFIVLLIFLFLHKSTGNKIIHFFRIITRVLPSAVRTRGDRVFDQIAVFQGAGWKFHIYIGILTLLASVVGAAVTQLLAAQGANIHLSFTVFIWLSAMIYVLSRLPITFANIGLRDVSLMSALSIYGITNSAALLMSLILLSAVFFMAGIGAVYQMVWFSKNR